MQKKKNHSNIQRVNLSNIINNLPINYHLSKSQNALIAFSKTWNTWIQHNLPKEIQTRVALNGFNNGILLIQCTNAVAASQLKHLQMRLISAFHDAGHDHILDIKIEIDKTISSSKNELSTASKDQHIEKEPRKTLSHEALDTLKHCEKGIKNERLSAALKKLHGTLDNLNKPSSD